MARAHSSQLWDHTCALVAAVGTMISSKEIDPNQLHPFKRKGEKPDITLGGKQGIAFLKRFYGGR